MSFKAKSSNNTHDSEPKNFGPLENKIPKTLGQDIPNSTIVISTAGLVLLYMLLNVATSILINLTSCLNSLIQKLKSMQSQFMQNQ